ncbi:MAG: hypothetical protein QOI55_2614 [Actinomycetota bacterium]|jgi:HSP20 family protein|nr:hypothetical protein [Actinomycetota bacterium]
MALARREGFGFELPDVFRRDDAGYRSEFRYGSFVRNIALPAGVDADDIHASYKDGILEVRIPAGKEQKPETKRIRVSRD